MDYHFVKAPNETANTHSGLKIGKTLIKFLPLFVLSLFLPFLVAYVVTPPEIGFFTRADSASELSIWVSPANAITNANSPIVLEIMAQYDGENLIPELTFDIASDNGASLSATQINYAKPFSGKVSLGQVTLTPGQKGDTSVIIPEELVEVKHTVGPVTVKTRGAKIIVRD